MTVSALSRVHSRRRRLIAGTFAAGFVLALGYGANAIRTADDAQAGPAPAVSTRVSLADAPVPVADTLARPAARPAAQPVRARPAQPARVGSDKRQRTSYHISAPPAAQSSPGSQQDGVPQQRSSPSSTGAYSNSSYAYSVLAQLNDERAAHGRPALRMNSLLMASAHAHNLTMARFDEMSHQLPGEAYFSDRITAAGYDYRNAGENIGWNSAVSRNGALELESDMYAEGPPANGQVNHYWNIVSSNYTEVGIEVWIDPVHHKLWLTEDFGSR